MTTVDFYYSIGSRYSYLASTQLARLERETGCRMRWRPMNSRAYRSSKGQNPFDGEPASGQYEWPYREEDARRWAEFYGIPFVEPRGRIEFHSELWARACAAACLLDRGAEFSGALFTAVHDGLVDVLDEIECVRIAEATGIAGRRFREELESPRTTAALEETMADARAAGVFGVPSFVVDGAMFWGNDRLVLLRHHLLQSRSGRSLA